MILILNNYNVDCIVHETVFNYKLYVVLFMIHCPAVVIHGRTVTEKLIVIDSFAAGCQVIFTYVAVPAITEPW